MLRLENITYTVVPEEGKAGIAECIVAKNRHGELGTVKLAFQGEFTQFTGLDLHHDE